MAWASFQIIDHKSRFATGTRSFRLWGTGKANPIGVGVENLSDPNPAILVVDFEKFPKPIVFKQVINSLSFTYPHQALSRGQ